MSTMTSHAHDAEVQRRLTLWNRARLTPRLPADLDASSSAGSDQGQLEHEFIAAERARVAPRAARVPREPAAFVAWFESLEQDGPGQGDPLFPYLADHATFEEMRYFLTQEVAGEAGFEDLLALTQVKLPEQAKLEVARNFWDEMGRGHEVGMHGPMLGRLARALDVNAPLEVIEPEPLALANLMAAMALDRQYAFHSIGALGVIELTAPGRATLVNRGLGRLGVEAHERQYFALHATLDRQHSAAWDREVLMSLAGAHPQAARAMAEGALMRLEAGRRCFERYRKHLGI